MSLHAVPPPLSPALASALLEYSPQYISCWTESLENIYCNKALLDFLGIDTLATFQKKHTQFYPTRQPNQKFSVDMLHEMARHAMVDGKSQCAFVFCKQSGEEFSAQVQFTHIVQDNTGYLLCHLTPLYSVKEPEPEESNDSDALARQIMNTSLLGSTLWNDKLELMDCTHKHLEPFGVGKEEFISTFFSFCPDVQPDGRYSQKAFMEYLQKALDEGYCSFIWTSVDRDNTPFFIRIALVSLVLEGKKYILSYTSEKNSHELAVSNVISNYDRMQLLLKHLPIGVDLWNKNFELFDCNEATLHLFGVKTKEEYIKRFKEFTPEFQPCGKRSQELIPQHLNEVFEKGYTRFEWMHVSADGEELPAEISIIRTKNGEEDIAVVYYKDLRDVKANMREVEQRLADINNILDSAPYAVNTWSKDFVPVDCNLASLALYGFESKEEYLQNFHKVMPETQKDGRNMTEVFVKRFTEAFTSGYAYDEGELINIKSQTTFPVEITLKKLNVRGEERVITYLNDVSLQKSMMAEIADSHQALTIARDAAEKSAKVKGEFLANMSHEIRTPMNGILGLLHILSRTKLLEQQKFYVDKILYSAESLLRIINDILDFSKIEAGKLEMEYVPFSLDELQDELRTLFAHKFLEKNIQGEIFSENILDTKLVGDPLRLKQVLLNLIGNAVKFTENGRVCVSIENISYEGPHRICYHFLVEDTGIGLSDEQASRLFEAFTQADTSTTRKYGGTGLGLAISKRIVEMMQGTIWVESEEGKGARFQFTAVFDLDMSHIAQEESFDLDAFIEAPKFITSGHILLVEDNEINQLIATELITSQGHTVDVANNGQEAVDMINSCHYDMVFMDIQMPVMDGLTATRTIRAMERFAKLPIIAMSAHAMSGDKEISLSHGMNDHLSKPISPELLYNSIDTWLNIGKVNPTTIAKK